MPCNKYYIYIFLSEKPKIRKNKQDPIAVMLKVGIIFVIYLLPIWQPLFVYMEFDPSLHALKLAGRLFTANVFKQKLGIIYDLGAVILRWAVTYWVTVEGARVGILVVMIMLFGLRLWIATLRKVHGGIERNQG